MKDLLDTLNQHHKAGTRPPTIAPPVAVQHNELIEACYTMTLTEKRILLFGISKVLFNEYPYMGDDLKFKISVADWCRLFGIQHGSIYSDLKSATESLLTRTVLIPLRPAESIRFAWFDHCRYFDNEGVIVAKFGETAKEYLCGLRERFTSVDLLKIADLRSFHAIRIYELLAQWKTTRFRTLAVDDLRKILQLETEYPKFSALKKWVLDPAIAELNAHTDIKPTLEIEYTGRVATRLNFSW